MSDDVSSVTGSEAKVLRQEYHDSEVDERAYERAVDAAEVADYEAEEQAEQNGGGEAELISQLEAEGYTEPVSLETSAETDISPGNEQALLQSQQEESNEAVADSNAYAEQSEQEMDQSTQEFDQYLSE